jgi:AraC family transcriptional regulator
MREAHFSKFDQVAPLEPFAGVSTLRMFFMAKPTEQTVEHHRQQILKVLAHVQGHLDQDLSMDELARIAAFSEFHFHRIFREIVGEPVAEHVRRLRLERAALELYYTDRPVKRIAADVGYRSNEAFTRSFTAQFGAPPAHYRARLAEPWGSSLENVKYTRAEMAGFEPFRLEDRIRRIDIAEIAPRRVAYMRSVGPYKTELAAKWGQFGQWLLGRGIDPRSLKMNIPLDNPDVTPADKLRADVCVEVPEDFQPRGEVGIQMSPGGTYAVAVHIGPWTLAGLAWHWLFNIWLPRSGHRYRLAPAFEIFWDTPETPLADWEIHIHLPIEPAAR